MDFHTRDMLQQLGTGVQANVNATKAEAKTLKISLRNLLKDNGFADFGLNSPDKFVGFNKINQIFEKVNDLSPLAFVQN